MRWSLTLLDSKLVSFLVPLELNIDVLCTVNQSPPGDAGTGSALMSPPHYAPGVWVVMVKVDLTHSTLLS